MRPGNPTNGGCKRSGGGGGGGGGPGVNLLFEFVGDAVWLVLLPLLAAPLEFPPSLTSAKPLIFNPSATFSKDERFSWSIDTSPLYMNSNSAFISWYRTSRKNTIGCRSGVLYSMD